MSIALLVKRTPTSKPQISYIKLQSKSTMEANLGACTIFHKLFSCSRFGDQLMQTDGWIKGLATDCMFMIGWCRIPYLMEIGLQASRL